MVKVLLDRGIRHTIEDNDGWTALHHAVYNGNPHEDDTFDSAFDQLYEASRRKFYLPTRYRKPMTAHRAAENDSVLEGTDFLFMAGADLYARVYGLSALDVAVERGREKMVETLLETYKINPNHLPSPSPPTNNAIAIAAGATNPDPDSEELFPPLHRACTHSSHSIVDTLLQSGADPNLLDPSSGQTALHNAALEDKHELIPLLISHRADPNPTDVHGRTPLHYACELGYLRTVRILLKYLPSAKKQGSDNNIDLPIDLPDSEQNTPLHLAVLNDRHELIQPLLHAGADARRRDGSNKTAVGIAVVNKLYRIKKIFARVLGHEVLEREEREVEEAERRARRERRRRLVYGVWEGRSVVID